MGQKPDESFSIYTRKVNFILNVKWQPLKCKFLPLDIKEHVTVMVMHLFGFISLKTKLAQLTHSRAHITHVIVHT